ncbi:MAG: hypothetical protein LBJ93_04430 [Clostridiales bacterium]|jgi:hypothetical protein|nr:hypothetical protein [Clostridiales bacterium]
MQSHRTEPENGMKPLQHALFYSILTGLVLSGISAALFYTLNLSCEIFIISSFSIPFIITCLFLMIKEKCDQTKFNTRSKLFANDNAENQK